MVNPSSSQSSNALNSEVESSLVVPKPLPSPAGYAAPASVQSSEKEDDQVALMQLAAKILQDPLAVRKLSDQVFKLLQEDVYLQRERNRGYGMR